MQPAETKLVHTHTHYFNGHFSGDSQVPLRLLTFFLHSFQTCILHILTSQVKTFRTPLTTSHQIFLGRLVRSCQLLRPTTLDPVINISNYNMSQSPQSTFTIIALTGSNGASSVAQW